MDDQRSWADRIRLWSFSWFLFFGDRVQTLTAVKLSLEMSAEDGVGTLQRSDGLL